MENIPPDTGPMTNRLAAELQRWGICHLTAGDDPLAQADVLRLPLDGATLLAYLAAEPDPRVNAACVALLLRHPELVSALPQALEQAEALAREARESLIVLCLAAAYLQQTMYQKLTWVLGSQPMIALPATFWEERNLPPPTPATSESGLEALNRYEQERYDEPLEYQGDWRSAADHLFKQEWLARQKPILEARKIPPASTGEALLRRVAEAAEAWVQAQDPSTFVLTLQMMETTQQTASRSFQVRVSVEPNVWRHLPISQVFTERWVVVRIKDGDHLQIEVRDEEETL